MYCDFKKMFDVSIGLHKVGLYLQLDPSRLRDFMKAGGRDAEKLVLEEPLDIGEWRRIATRLDKKVKNDEEADDDDREEVSTISDKAEKDVAANMMAWFFADVNIAFLLSDPRNEQEKEWATKSAERLVRWSTSSTWRDVLGDPLTDAMRPIYWDKKALVRFSHAGGLGALYGDWVRVFSPRSYVVKYLKLSVPKSTKALLKSFARRRFQRYQMPFGSIRQNLPYSR